MLVEVSRGEEEEEGGVVELAGVGFRHDGGGGES